MAVNAATWFSDGSSASVQALYDQDATHDGDTITIPAGTFTWSTGVQFPRPGQSVKAITLQGAGANSTIIRDNVQSGQLILITLAANNLTRITGIQFVDGGRVNPAPAPGGIMRVVGNNTNGSQFRWDNCIWNGLQGFPVMDTVIGVIDHNTFGPLPQYQMIYVYGSFWNNQGADGDGSWAAPTGFGSSQWLFIEDNTWLDSGQSVGAIDSENGGRWVFRYNHVHGSFPSNHGTESGGRGRGARAMEVYNNDFANTYQTAVGGSRGGSVLVHDNIAVGYLGWYFWDLGNWRNTFPFSPWGGADGVNTWDVNDPAVYFTGTAAAPNSSVTITFSGNPNWATNQWARYTLRRLTDNGGSGTINFGWILSSTANTITFYGQTYGPNMSCVTGDTFEIRKIIHELDQTGRAEGSLITGNPPVRPPNWNDQINEPARQWNNLPAAFSFEPGPGINPTDYIEGVPLPGYTPYIYPHPLVSGASPTPTPTATETPTATASPSATATATATATAWPSHP